MVVFMFGIHFMSKEIKEMLGPRIGHIFEIFQHNDIDVLFSQLFLHIILHIQLKHFHNF